MLQLCRSPKCADETRSPESKELSKECGGDSRPSDWLRTAIHSLCDSRDTPPARSPRSAWRSRLAFPSELGQAESKGWRTSDPRAVSTLSLIHISEPTRLLSISYAVFCLKKKKK